MEHDDIICLWETVTKEHGHICPGVTIGFKAALYAKMLLELDFSEGDSVVCTTENSSCPVDAIKLIMKCDIQRGSISTSSNDKLEFAFSNKITGKGIKLSYLNPVSNGGSREETQMRIFNASPEELFAVEVLEAQTRPLATVTMANGVKILIELYPDEAPNTVNSFIYLANCGFFDNHAIERIIPGAFVDMSYRAFGHEECKYLIEPETRAVGFPNQLRAEPGVIHMGGYGAAGIAAGEFFFPLVVSPKLDGQYPGFGKVIQGWEEIERWATVELVPVTIPQNPSLRCNAPKEPIVIASVRVETWGKSYPLPQRKEMLSRPATWQ